MKEYIESLKTGAEYVSYPFLLCPVAVSKLWGGERLRREIHPEGVGFDGKIGESLELCVRRDVSSVIKNGSLAGRTLSSVIAEYPRETVGKVSADANDFPLLVKFIDASEKLSVQVHPDSEYARRYETDGGKTEMWYIMDAEPDSEILLGLSNGYRTEDLFCRKDPTDALEHIKVRAGDIYFIPAGTPHAIGAGILLAEIQQNSDLTYRIWDYERRDGNGCLRQLNTEKARRVIKRTACGRIFPKDGGVLAEFNGLKVSLPDIRGGTTLTGDSFYSVLCVDGCAEMSYGGGKLTVSKGDSWFIPKAVKKLEIKGDAVILLSAPNKCEA